MVFVDSGALRRSGEDSMAAELDRRGLEGIASYILIEDRDVKSEERLRAAIERAGAVGVIAIRPLASPPCACTDGPVPSFSAVQQLFDRLCSPSA